MTNLVRRGGRGGGGTGFTLGPEQNVFTGADRAAAESARDTYFTANPSNLAAYNNDTSLNIRLEFTENSDPMAEYQVRNDDGDAWLENEAFEAIQGRPGQSGATFKFSSISDRDNFFIANPTMLENGLPIDVTVIVNDDNVVRVQTWTGPDNPTSYNPTTDSFRFIDSTVGAGVSSFDLGTAHRISSGGENIYFQNLDSDINYFPPWQSVGDHSNPNDRVVQNRPTARTYGALTPTEFGGAVATSGSVQYEVDFTLPANESVNGVVVVPAEAYTGVIAYEVERIRPSGNNDIFRRTVSVTAVAGTELNIWFTSPLDGRQGTQTMARIIKDDGTMLQVRPTSADSTNPWTRVQLRNFTDDGLAYQSELNGAGGPGPIERRDTSLTITSSNIATYRPQYAFEFTNETGQLDLVIEDDVFTVGDELQIKHFSRGGIAGAQVRVEQQGSDARIDEESDQVVIQDAAMIMRYVAANTWRIFASHDFAGTSSGSRGTASLHALSTNLPNNINIGENLTTSVEVTYNVTNHSDIRTLQLSIDGQDFTPTLPTRDGSHTETFTVSAISTTAPRTITVSLGGFRQNGSPLNQITSTTNVVIPPPFVYFGRSTSNNPALVDVSGLSSARRSDPITISTGTAVAGDYFIFLTAANLEVSDITDTVLDQSVLSLFTKTDNVRQISGLEYDSYVIGPLVAGVDENYVVEF